MPYLLAGPFVALVGILAVFFVLRRKSVEKRSMYSARRSQIEHKVRAARQRTLAPRGHKPAEQTIPAAEASPFAATQTGQPMAIYDTAAYQAPPAAPPAPSPFGEPAQAPGPAPSWDMPAAAPTSSPAPSFDYPPAAPETAYAPPQAPPFEPAQAPAPSEPVWTPAPEPAPPAEHLEPAAQQTASAAAAGSWSVVTTEKESAATVVPDGKRKKGRGGDDAGSWQLASGEAPGAEDDEPAVKRSNATLMAVAQYAVLVVGLVMVLIGVIVMLANSKIT